TTPRSSSGRSTPSGAALFLPGRRNRSSLTYVNPLLVGATGRDSRPMQHTAEWNFARPDNNRLIDLMKLFGCADVIAPIDAESFGRRVGELLTRAVSGEQHVPQNVLKIDRVRPGAPRVRMPSTHPPITLTRKVPRYE